MRLVVTGPCVRPRSPRNRSSEANVSGVQSQVMPASSPSREAGFALLLEGRKRLRHVVGPGQQRLPPVLQLQCRGVGGDLLVALDGPLGYPHSARRVGRDEPSHGQRLVEELLGRDDAVTSPILAASSAWTMRPV